MVGSAWIFYLVISLGHVENLSNKQAEETRSGHTAGRQPSHV